MLIEQQSIQLTKLKAKPAVVEQHASSVTSPDLAQELREAVGQVNSSTRRDKLVELSKSRAVIDQLHYLEATVEKLSDEIALEKNRVDNVVKLFTPDQSPSLNPSTPNQSIERYDADGWQRRFLEEQRHDHFHVADFEKSSRSFSPPTSPILLFSTPRTDAFIASKAKRTPSPAVELTPPEDRSAEHNGGEYARRNANIPQSKEEMQAHREEMSAVTTRYFHNQNPAEEGTQDECSPEADIPRMPPGEWRDPHIETILGSTTHYVKSTTPPRGRSTSRRGSSFSSFSVPRPRGPTPPQSPHLLPRAPTPSLRLRPPQAAPYTRHGYNYNVGSPLLNEITREYGPDAYGLQYY